MSPAPSSSRAQTGMALITAILIAALVASLAFALSARERLWLTLINNRNDLVATQSFTLSAIDLARLTLRDDMRNNQVDHIMEPWTIPVPPINVEEGKVAGRLIELQGRFNLYNLYRNGQVSQSALLSLQRLLSTRNLPTDWAEKMARAMMTQATLWQQSQAKNPQSRKTTSRMQLVTNLSELADLSGIDREKLLELEPLITILPGESAINVNFASPEVLMAVTQGLSLKDAENIVNRRASSYFKSVQEFISIIPTGARTSVNPTNYTVQSQYFFSESEAWYGRAHLRIKALLFRQSGAIPEIIWVRRD